jgi:hypothetical protein
VTTTGRAEAVADRVREAANNAGLSTLGLAELAGIPYPTLQRRLKLKPEYFTVDELVRISEATHTDFSWLASGLVTA